MAELRAGITGEETITVTEENTAQAMGSGTLPVFATPAMIALAEKTAWQSVQPCLEAGDGTVGTKISMSHMAPTPLGMRVTCKSRLTEIKNRCLVFAIEVYDGTEKVGEGTHERFVIHNAKFLEKANHKADRKE